MKTYDEAIDVIANRILLDQNGFRYARWVAMVTIAEIYEVHVDKVWEDIEKLISEYNEIRRRIS